MEWIFTTCVLITMIQAYKRILDEIRTDRFVDNNTADNNDQNLKPNPIFTDNPTLVGRFVVEDVEPCVGLPPKYRCKPCDHIWIYTTRSTNKLDRKEPETGTMCQCGQKYWLRSDLFPSIHGHGEYVFN